MEDGSKRSGLTVALVIGAVLVLAAAAWYWKPWQKWSASKRTDLVAPALDAGHGRQVKITAKDGGSISVVDTQKVRITLEVPPGSLAADTTIQLIPFLPKADATYPTSGVMVSPGGLAFTKPATLTFDLKQTNEVSDAPASFALSPIRVTGSSQVLLLDAKADTLTPMLVSRPAETKTTVPARIASGGSFVWDVKGAKAETYAKEALAAKELHPLVALEAGSRLLGSGKKLTRGESKGVTRAVTGLLAADPAGPELFAAVALNAKHNIGQANGLIAPAYAADLNRGYLETRCKDRSLSLNDYLTAAQTAQLLGFDDLGETCLTAAKNVVAEESEAVLSGANPDPVELMIQLQRVQILGLDDESNLDERLLEKAQTQVTKEGRDTLNDPNATAVDVAKALQKIQAIGGNDATVESGLGAKLEQLGAVDVDPIDLEGEHEDLIPGFDMAVIALPLAQFLGLDSFDEQGIRGFTDKWLAKEGAFKEMAGVMCAAIAELGGTPPPECSTYEAEFTRLFDELEREGYRAADEVGQIQDQEYEAPEYDDAQITIDCDALTEEERRDAGCPPEDEESAPDDADTESQEDAPEPESDQNNAADDLEDSRNTDSTNEADPEEDGPDAGGGE